MSSTLMSPDGVFRAECECGWSLERSIDAGEQLNPEENKEIAEAVARNHAFHCGGDDWEDKVSVEMEGQS